MPRQESTSAQDQGATFPTFVVAAQNASLRVRRTADFICDGSRADDVEWQEALDALPSGGGRLVGSEGTFVFTQQVTRAISNVAIIGCGAATRFNLDASTPVFSAGSQTGWLFADFDTDAGGVALATDTVARYWKVGVLQSPHVQFVEGWVTVADQNPDLGPIPIGAFPIETFVWVEEAFNSSGIDILTVGHGGNPAAYADGAGIDVSGTGVKTVALGVDVRKVSSVVRTAEALYTKGGTTPTTGKVHVLMAFLCPAMAVP